MNIGAGVSAGNTRGKWCPGRAGSRPRCGPRRFRPCAGMWPPPNRPPPRRLATPLAAGRASLHIGSGGFQVVAGGVDEVVQVRVDARQLRVRIGQLGIEISELRVGRRLSLEAVLGQVALPAHYHLAVGEVDLHGQIRPCSVLAHAGKERKNQADTRKAYARKLGESFAGPVHSRCAAAYGCSNRRQATTGVVGNSRGPDLKSKTSQRISLIELIFGNLDFASSLRTSCSGPALYRIRSALKFLFS